MKKTKEALIKFIGEYYEPYDKTIAEALIKRGWVELDKPREFKIYYDKNTGNIRPYRGPGAHAKCEQIIHVREVIDKDQCLCQKIKIGSHLNGSDIIHIDDVPYYIDNDCPIHGGKDNE